MTAKTYIEHEAAQRIVEALSSIKKIKADDITFGKKKGELTITVKDLNSDHTRGLAIALAAALDDNEDMSVGIDGNKLSIPATANEIAKTNSAGLRNMVESNISVKSAFSSYLHTK